MDIKYLGIKITSEGNINKEYEEQVNKVNRVAGCLNNLIWYNKNMRTETKTRIYKSVVRPTITYSVETAAVTSKIKNKMSTLEMRVLRKIKGCTLRDRIRNDNIRESCQITPITEWVASRRQEWNEHVSRMEDDRSVKQARDKIPRGTRTLGRPKKRWKDELS